MAQKILKYLKIAGISLIVVALLAYIAFAVIKMSEPDPEERCTGVELIISNSDEANFITTNDIELLLKSKHIYPQGQLMIKIDTKLIEDLIRENKFVNDVNCYKTAQSKLCVKVKQRIPVIFIMPEGKDPYYVDKGGNIIPCQEYFVGTPIATGHIDKEYASRELADFGQFLRTNEFWNNQIEQIHITRNNKRKHLVELIPRVGDHTIYLGPITDYNKKLNHLHVFYEKAMGTVGWNKYSRINLEFRNQIICTKRK